MTDVLTVKKPMKWLQSSDTNFQGSDSGNYTTVSGRMMRVKVTESSKVVSSLRAASNMKAKETAG